MTTKVTLTRRGRLGLITIDRPDVANAMDLDAHAQLSAAVDALEADPDLWIGVLTGAGDRVFCAGQDLRELAARNEHGAPLSSLGSAGASGRPRLTERFDRSTPLIARVNGHAVGGGFELALACDIIVAADHATFSLPEARLGLVAGAGGAIRLPRRLPYHLAVGHLLTGRPLAAGRAHQLGMINDVVPTSELDDCVDGWVEDLLACSPVAVRAARDIAVRSRELGEAEAFGAVYPWEEMRLGSPDPREGPLAFRDRRTPVWAAPPSASHLGA